MARKPDHHPNQANLEIIGKQQYCPLSDLAALAERRRVLYAEMAHAHHSAMHWRAGLSAMRFRRC
jgi:hypothetical protein